jgi:ankyrin repeat protein
MSTALITCTPCLRANQVFKKVKVLLSAMDPALINTQDKDGYTPLHFAVNEERSAETINLLIGHGADVNAR